MTRIGSLNDRVKKKYDSVNLHPNTRIQSRKDAIRGFRSRTGYDAVNVWLARYFLDLPATRSPNIRPEGIVANVIVAMTEQQNCTIPRINDTCPVWLKKAM